LQKGLSPRLHTLFAYNFSMNGAILILVGMYMGIDYMNEVSFKKCLKMWPLDRLWALRKKLKNAKSQDSSFFSFRDLSVHV